MHTNFPIITPKSIIQSAVNFKKVDLLLVHSTSNLLKGKTNTATYMFPDIITFQSRIELEIHFCSQLAFDLTNTFLSLANFCFKYGIPLQTEPPRPVLPEKLKLEFEPGKVLCNGHQILELRGKKFEILREISKSKNGLKQAELEDSVWNMEPKSPSTVRGYISSINNHFEKRYQLSDNDRLVKRIDTGYRATFQIDLKVLEIIAKKIKSRH
ncbi:hypothetical protein [Gimesia sp.]|uniref:hypothetical protein n=1 Tax=Gimesia sp. TaxID=2024833 RepID=UPI003A915306